MPATVTLSTTTLEGTVGSSDVRIKVLSTTGLTPGTRLFLDGELMTVVSLEADPWVKVLRGQDGTSGLEHHPGETIYIGRADQFYSMDPVGTPSDAIHVSPYINVTNGSIWFARGDAYPKGRRWWQKQDVAHAVGALGVRTETADISSST